MKKRIVIHSLLYGALSWGLLTGCLTGKNESDEKYEVPNSYLFGSRFEAGVSSVDYPGQTTRQLLIQELKIYMDWLGGNQSLITEVSTSKTGEDLLNFFQYNGTTEETYSWNIKTSVGGLSLSSSNLRDISSTKTLEKKTATDPILGGGEFGGKTPGELIKTWLNEIGTNSSDGAKLGTFEVFRDSKGRDLSQLVHKLLHGTVSYYQAFGIYLNRVVNGSDGVPLDNEVAKKKGEDNLPYTNMEHTFDEAWGYFGGARNYSDFTDNDLAGKDGGTPYKDINGDGSIDLESEYNFGFSTNAGKRDRGATDEIDFTKDIFQAFLAGRTAVANREHVDNIKTHVESISENWEKIISATIVHYINETLADMTSIESDSAGTVKNLSKHWSELKGFSLGLQYNPFKMISDDDLISFHEKIGDAPIFSNSSEYRAKLLEARNILKDTYSFSTSNAENW